MNKKLKFSIIFIALSLVPIFCMVSCANAVDIKKAEEATAIETTTNLVIETTSQEYSPDTGF